MLHNNSVDVSVEGQHEDCRSDNGGKVQENQVVVIHNFYKVTGFQCKGNTVIMPSKQRKKSNDCTSHPAHCYYPCKRKEYELYIEIYHSLFLITTTTSVNLVTNEKYGECVPIQVSETISYLCNCIYCMFRFRVTEGQQGFMFFSSCVDIERIL